MQQDTTTPPAKESDTIYPGSFYPIYPGSFWEYSINGGTGSKRMEASADYMLDSFVTINGNPQVYSKPKYVPYLDGNPIYGYNKVITNTDHGSNYSKRLWPFLSEHIGDTIVGGSSVNSAYFEESLWIEKLDDIDGRKILTVQCFTRVYNPAGRKTRVYEKNVGLIAYYEFSPNGDTTYREELTNYFINK